MPRRTNAFQRIIALLEHQLAPVGATVTESATFIDYRPKTPRTREIDVEVQTGGGKAHILIAVECADHRRAQDVKWIEQLRTKYDGTGYHVVAVSRSGFTPYAEELANFYGMETMTIEEATSTSWLDWVRDRPPVEVIVVHPAPLNIRIAMTDGSVIVCDYDSTDARSMCLYDGDARVIGDVRDHYHESCRDNDIVAELLLWHAFHRLAPPLYLTQTFDRPPTLRLGDGRNLPVEEVTYEVDPNPEWMSMTLDPGRYRGHHIAMATETTKTWYAQASFIETDKPGMGNARGALWLRPRRSPRERMELRFYPLPHFRGRRQGEPAV